MIEPSSLLRVAIGGAVGTIARHLLLDAVGPAADEAMLIAINGVGSLVIGLLIGRGIDDRQKALLATGLCGGFTSFSTFAVSVARSLEGGASLAAGRNTLLTTAVAIAAVAIGLKLGGHTPHQLANGDSNERPGR